MEWRRGSKSTPSIHGPPWQTLTRFQHWHGLSQRMSIFSDGTPVSQWPIAPMHYFDYEILPGESDTGTSFYHSHVGFQAVTANGALIVEDVRSPPYHYDGERIFQLTDYFNKTDSVIEQGLTSNPFVWSGETNGLLINGVGVGIGKQNDSSCKLPVVDVLPGKIYRFRIIGATALSHVSMAFESHENLTIIAADARYTRRITMTVQQFQNGSIYWAQNGTPKQQLGPNNKILVCKSRRSVGDDNPEYRIFGGKNAGGLDIHPFHAHGGHFWDIGCGDGMYDVVANEEKLKGYRPVLRDTTMLYRYADVGEAGKDANWRGWRLRVNQPGVYVIHCHIL
ncbi:L-ascorbate oxidase [Aureobasidium pullulans]|uniref:L-ascorbate oxidase n=1 Tax=Aureobasidium pullulans TaxID=5580 RepID=A0A4T0B565_AURPU|nr:L-ascorbate oxidase [Aureobasidium pullulans]